MLVEKIVEDSICEVEMRSPDTNIVSIDDLAENIALYLCTACPFFIDVAAVTVDNVIEKLKPSLVLTIDSHLNPHKKETIQEEISKLIK